MKDAEIDRTFGSEGFHEQAVAGKRKVRNRSKMKRRRNYIRAKSSPLVLCETRAPILYQFWSIP